MAVSDDRKYTKTFIYDLLEGVKGKTLGEVDSSRQFDRALNRDKITGIAGDVIEQSVFGYARDSKQECDIEIDGVRTELKTTGLRIPKSLYPKVKKKTGEEYNIHLEAKEGISITGVTFDPTRNSPIFLVYSKKLTYMSTFWNRGIDDMDFCGLWQEVVGASAALAAVAEHSLVDEVADVAAGGVLRAAAVLRPDLGLRRKKQIISAKMRRLSFYFHFSK